MVEGRRRVKFGQSSRATARNQSVQVSHGQPRREGWSRSHGTAWLTSLIPKRAADQ